MPLETEAYRIAEEVHKGALANDRELREECRESAETLGLTAEQVYRAVYAAYRYYFEGKYHAS